MFGQYIPIIPPWQNNWNSITECVEAHSYVRPDLACFKKDETVNTEVHKARTNKLCLVARNIYVTARHFGKFVDLAVMNKWEKEWMKE